MRGFTQKKMEETKIKSIIESILFVSGAPVAIKKLAAVISVSEEEINKALVLLEADLKNRGLALTFKNEEVQLSTAPGNADFVAKYLQEDLREDLSKAALETLAVIAYRGPIGRIDIESTRGVNSSFILRALLIRGLLDRVPNPKDKRSYLYKISFKFLNKLGVSKDEELPGYKEFREDKRFDMVVGREENQE